MKKMLILAIACAMVVVLAATSATARRSYATLTGKPCGYCHIDPGGGGPLTPEGEYYFDNGTLPPTPTVPAAPASLSATATSTSQINLAWTDASSDETGFKVQRGDSSGGPFTDIATVGAGATTYSNTGLNASTTYHYRVCATNAVGDSGYSNVASATTQTPPPPPPPPPTVPAAPAGLSATATSTSQINLAWTDASSDETGFKVQRGDSSGGPFTDIATVGAGATTYSNTGLNASTTYHYRVCATNAVGDSGYSNVASATTQTPPPPPPPPPTVPAAPTGLSATATSTSQINLAWTDASSDETGFKVQRGDSSGGPFMDIATVGAGATTYSNTGLNASTTYHYRVCATNAVGDSGYSNTASATTETSPPQPPPPPEPGALPAAPTGLAVTGARSSEIDLTWTDNSSDETGFEVERADGPGETFTVVATLEADVTSYSDTGLATGRTYYYRICAYNTVGDSEYSDTVPGSTVRGATNDDDDERDDDDDERDDDDDDDDDHDRDRDRDGRRRHRDRDHDRDHDRDRD